jgi:hypothetical protein
MWNRKKSDMVRCYIFSIGTILTSQRDNEFFLLRDVGTTYLTVGSCADSFLNYLC